MGTGSQKTERPQGLRDSETSRPSATCSWRRSSTSTRVLQLKKIMPRRCGPSGPFFFFFQEWSWRFWPGRRIKVGAKRAPKVLLYPFWLWEFSRHLKSKVLFQKTFLFSCIGRRVGANTWLLLGNILHFCLLWFSGKSNHLTAKI